MIKIRLAELKDSYAITELLNKVTLHLHNKGINQWVFPWNEDIIKDDIKEKLVYVLEVDNLVIGTFSIKDSNDVNVNIICPENKYLYRIAILPEYQGLCLGSKIIKFSLDYSRKMNKSLFLDCWAGNSKLKDFYKSEGFDLIGEIPEEGYFISVFKSK